MRKFSGKYDVLLETAIQRFQQGGFLIGDLVKIKKNALSNEKLKGISFLSFSSSLTHFVLCFNALR